MSHKPATPNEFPPRVWVDIDGDNGVFAWTGAPANLLGKEYISIAEHEALLAIERAKAFEEAALIVDKRETPGVTALVLRDKAKKVRDGK